MKTPLSEKPTCPICGQTFDTPEIEGGYVRCPACSTPMFQYRFVGDDDMTPKRFMTLLHGRGNDAINTVAEGRWFSKSALRYGKAALFVMRMWPTLALVFEKNAEQEAEPVDVA